MEETSLYHSNPWADDDRCFGAIRNVLIVAERSGHMKGQHLNTALLLSEARENDDSLKMFSHMKNISSRRRQIHQAALDFDCRMQDKETKDLTHTDVLEKRIGKINSLNDHVQRIVAHKDQLISRLQQPYVGDYLRIEAKYQRFVSELFPQLVPVLSELSTLLENIEWANQVNMNDGQLESLLSDISSSLAGLQSNFQSLCQMRKTVGDLHDQRKHQTTPG